MLSSHAFARTFAALITLVVAASLVAPGVAQRKKKKDEPEEVLGDRHELTEPDIALTFVGLDGFARDEVAGDAGQLKARWRGKLEDRDVEVSVWLLEFQFDSPRDVVDLVEENRARRGPFEFQESFAVGGKFGKAPFGWIGVHTEHEETKPVSNLIVLGAILPASGYTVQVDARPALLDEQKARVLEFLEKGVRYGGETWDPEWTDEEVDARWQADAPDGVLEKSNFIAYRTEHYLILTNLGKGTTKGFAEKMDENYEKVRAVYPFEDVPGQRLLPIFYFVDRDQYLDYCVKKLGWNREQASRSGGVASGDWYATYHQSPVAPVHIHEGTHQIFRNRLFLSGGGSWFQEGVAEYMSSSANDLKPIENAIEKGRHVPLRDFMQIQSMLMSASTNDIKGGNEAASNYDQAAAVVEFVSESKWGAEKFDEYIHAVGSVPRGDVAAIEQAIKTVYGVDIDGFEERFVEYWSDRKKQKSKIKRKKER